jgi:porin
VGCDRGDTWGLGWYFVGTSDEFGAIPRAKFGPRDGTGVELYYNVQVTPWLNITPDLQYVRPGLGRLTSGDDAFVYGLRLNARL